MKTVRVFLFLIVMALIWRPMAYGDEIYLKNGDRLTGKIAGETRETVSLETDAMGKLSVKKESIERLRREEKTAVKPEPEVVKTDNAAWGREVSLGYDRTSGNTDASQLNLDILLNRKREFIDELTLRGNIYYSSSNKQMDAQKWMSSARYAFSFGEDRAWYDFYKIETNHDRFANIDYRLVPSSGIGYWFRDSSDTKAMTEAAIGLEHTDYRDGQDDDDELLLIPRAYLEKNICGDTKISQDIILYSTLDDPGEYRLKSETVFINPVNEELSLKLSIVDEYDSKPAGDAKKNDFRFISSLTYSF